MEGQNANQALLSAGAQAGGAAAKSKFHELREWVSKGPMVGLICFLCLKLQDATSMTRTNFSNSFFCFIIN